MKTNNEILREITVELERFRRKLALAIREQEEKYPKHKHYASCKRAALDMKNELTKLTQDYKYKML